ncbi:MAG: hypothetical protein HDR17_14455 [Lachnospiraceae bacterium]|nr:hypothetical protein [Lachnospiraceae bacterium]
MKAQMKFQKWLCLAMIIVGALALLYAFCYMSGSLSELGQSINIRPNGHESAFKAASGKNDALLYEEMQPFNTMMMYFGIAMILLAVVLYITACNKRRNYYVTNYVATGLCAGGNIIMSVVCLIMNIHWRSEFLNVDFEAWDTFYQNRLSAQLITEADVHFGDSTAWFDLGFAVYAIVIVASILLILNMVWKIMLMKGEKQLLSNGVVTGGETV